MPNIFFIQQPNEGVLRVTEQKNIYTTDIDEFIRQSMQSLCDIHAAYDAVEEKRIETCKENLVVYMRFLNID